MYRFYHVFGDEAPQPAMGGAILVVQYAPKLSDGTADLKNTFLVESCHMPIVETHKLQACKWLKEEYPEERSRVFGSVTNIVRVGDFNTFMDKPESSEQIELLTAQLKHVNKSMTVAQEDLKPTDTTIEHTFVPFPHDCKPDVPKQSFLDYVFVSGGIEVVGEVLALQIPTTIPISDHLPLVVKLKLPSC